MMIRLLLLSCLTVLALPAADKPLNLKSEQKEEYAKSMTGVFDFKKQPRPYIGVLIFDQEDNRYPTFWTGKNLEGICTITTVYDELEDDIAMEMEGSLSVEINKTAFKHGMEDMMPGGSWIPTIREKPLVVTITGIEDMAITGLRKGNLFVDTDIASAAAEDSMLITVSGSFTGSIGIDGKQGDIKGPITLTFLDSVTMFTVKTTFDVPADKLGLTGDKAKGISATFYTSSTPMVSKPDIVESLRDKVPFELD